MKSVFGIDLGTTKSSVSIFRNNRAETIRAKGQDFFLSMVCYDIQDGTPQIDKCPILALNKTDKSKNLSGIKNCIYDVKRFIGRSYSHPRIQDIYKRYPFEVGESDDGQVEFRLQCANGPLSLSPQQVCSEILKCLKQAANKFISCDEEEEIEAVITVPAYFDNSQRKATIEAADLAGIKVLKLLNEETAAAIYHLYFSEITVTTMLVFDFGGGTTKISIIEADSSKNITVLATASDLFLGGVDINHNIFQFMQKEVKKNLDEKMTRKLRFYAETIKTQLTQYRSAYSEVVSDMDLEITRDIFNEINEDIFARCIIVAKECLKQANKKTRDIKEVLLVGGSSQIPELEWRIEDLFYNSTIVKSQDRTEIVCYGAALQASMIKGIPNLDLKISDMLNISLGYEASGGEMIYICKKQSKIPMTVDHEAVTIIKDQKKIVIKIYEGERKYVLYNTFLGSLTIGNLPPGPAGCTFKIKFTINESGILEVAIKYDEDHTKSITLDLNTSKRHQRTNIIDIGTNHEDQEFMEFNLIKIEAIFCCNKHINNSQTPNSKLGKIRSMQDELYRCDFEQTDVKTLRAIIRRKMQKIDISPFIEQINSILDKNN